MGRSIFTPAKTPTVCVLLWSCSAGHQLIVDAAALPRCEEASIEDLWNRPWAHSGKRVCVEGFLGQMVPHGEETAELFATAAEAASRHSDHKLTLDVLLSPENQELLARHSGAHLRVMGTFEFNARCWPNARTGESSRFRCAPPRPMELANPTIALID